MGALRKRSSRTAAPRPGTTRSPARFPRPILAAIREDTFLYIRAGTEHRFIGIWGVVVGGRVFVRSWSLKPRSWWRTFLEDPRGAIRIGEREIPVRARPARGAALNDAVDKAYLEKFPTPGWIKYAKDLARAKSRGTTTELLPDRGSRA
jgi:hypothetical protein